MLYIALIISFAHLALMNSLAYWRANLFGALLGSVAFVLLGCMFQVVFIQTVILFILFLLWHVIRFERASIYHVCSVVAVCIVYGAIAWETVWIQYELLQRYPMQSMAERVPNPVLGKPIDTVAEAKSWVAFESNLNTEVEMDQKRWGARTSSLRKLHEQTTETFVNSPGFGAVRMGNPVLRPGGYESQFKPVDTLPQPEPSQSLIFTTEDLNRPFVGKKSDTLRTMHFGALTDFVNIKGFGYIKDRRNVAGFRSHQFSKMPDAPLRIQRLELVSLLMHSKPAVYVSTELPRMGDFKHTATRNLSDFEAKGLVALQTGEDLFARETPTSLHLLGAIRSVGQCVKCHGGERGDLLGAFSYQLQK